VVITPESIEFPWISIWPLVKPHADYCVVSQTQSTLAATCVCWILPQIRRNAFGCLCFKVHLISDATDGGDTGMRNASLAS